MKKKLFICILILALLMPNFTIAMDDTRYYETSCKWETYFDNPDLFEKLSGLPYGVTPVAKGRLSYHHGSGKPYKVWKALKEKLTDLREELLEEPLQRGFY